MFLDPSSWLFVLVALLGACVGSFLHVLALRWSEVLNQVPQAGLIQALSGRSACPSCHHTLKAWHMVPVVSFALLRGRCAHCKAPIAWRDTLTPEELVAIEAEGARWLVDHGYAVETEVGRRKTADLRGADVPAREPAPRATPTRRVRASSASGGPGCR